MVAADVVPRMRELVAKPSARKGNAAVRFLTPDKAIVKLYRRIAKVCVEVVWSARDSDLNKGVPTPTHAREDADGAQGHPR